MRRRFSIVAVVTAALIAVAMMPAAAKPIDTRTGVHVNLFVGAWPPPGLTIDLEVDAAFFVSHGFGLVPQDEGPVGRNDFRLDIDGVDQGKGRLLIAGVGYEDPYLGLVKGQMARYRLFNFPEGLEAGTYTFTGHWFAPCRVAADLYSYPGPCPSPNAPIEILTISRTVEVS
jgi:hypothetical protein